MNRKQIVIILIAGASLLVGCARIQYQGNLKSDSLYMTTQKGYPSVKAVEFSHEEIDYKPIDKRIEKYLKNHPTTTDEIARDMREYAVSVGMNQEQVLTIAGKGPDQKKYNKQNEEVWVYGSVLMQGRVVLITFKNNYIVRIDEKYWDSCPQCH